MLYVLCCVCVFCVSVHVCAVCVCGSVLWMRVMDLCYVCFCGLFCVCVSVSMYLCDSVETVWPPLALFVSNDSNYFACLELG